MDVSTFFTRLIQAPKEVPISQAQDDLVEFETAWAAIKEVLEQPDERQLVRGISATTVPAQLRKLVDALVHESNRVGDGATGHCLEYLLEHQVLDELVSLSEADLPHGTKEEVVRACNNMVVLLSERFLVHKAVHMPLRRLIGISMDDEKREWVVPARAFGAAGMVRNGGRRGSRDEALEENLVDLMCVLCSRIRAYPPLLLIFFRGSDVADTPFNNDDDPNPLDSSLPPTQTESRFQFDLFSYLLRYVHREGRTGDFARAGLLFLFDIAFLELDEVDPEQSFSHPSPAAGRTDPLEEVRNALGSHILDGDFPQVISAGLGAIWSLLPSKLRVPDLASRAKVESGPNGNATEHKDDEDGLSDQPFSTSQAVQSQVDLLIKLFGFLQDILHRCLSTIDKTSSEDGAISNTRALGTAISDATLSAFRSSFLENVLYPSILECSSTDGSAVAVITYLDILFSHLDDGPLLDRILGFLLGRADPTNIARDARGSELFSLKDLIVDNLRSAHSVAKTAALRLLSTLIQQHEQTVLWEIISVLPVLPSTGLNRDRQSWLQLWGTLYSRLDPDGPDIEHSPGFASYLVDINTMLQSHRSFVRSRSRKDLTPGIYNLHDPTIHVILANLASFFQNSVDTNIALTGVVVDLTLSSNLKLAGLLFPSESAIEDHWDTDSDGKTEFHPNDNTHLYQGTDTAGSKAPILYEVISALVTQTSTFRYEIDGFDLALRIHRQTLLNAESTEETINPTLDIDSLRAASPSPAGARPGSPLSRKSRPSAFGGMLSLFSPKKRTATPGSNLTPDRPTTPERNHTPSSMHRNAATPSRGQRWADMTRMINVLPVALPTKETARGGALLEPLPSTPTPAASALSHNVSENGSTPGWSNLRGRAEEQNNDPVAVPLSRVLDNCVILEEFLKELTGVIMARQALGIDPVVY